MSLLTGCPRATHEMSLLTGCPRATIVPTLGEKPRRSFHLNRALYHSRLLIRVPFADGGSLRVSSHAINGNSIGGGSLMWHWERWMQR
ncbi:hypothetical protein GW17_00047126 [Ensete ventricosum]|nr:hypothetical protein GW17_00047126 [Ensete ventricosum]